MKLVNYTEVFMLWRSTFKKIILKNMVNEDFYGLFVFMYVIQHCFICRHSDSTVSEDAGIAPKNVATLTVTARRSNHLARSNPNKFALVVVNYMYTNDGL
jgi:hypothetical protein